MRIKEFVPPILLQTVRAMAAPRPYESWADAAAACSTRGYEQANLVNIVFEKTRRFRDFLNTNAPLQVCAADTSMLLALALTSARGTLEVIDFGGACGAHYFIAKRVLGEKVRFRWHVVETTAMATRARDLENDELRFFDDLHRAKQGLGTTDLLFSSGALQYVSHPYDTLKDLINCGAKHIFLTRLPLVTGDREVLWVQQSKYSANGPGALPANMTDGVARYPVVAPLRTRVEEILQDEYQILLRFDEERDAYWAAKRPIGTFGYFGRAKVASSGPNVSLEENRNA